MELWIGIAVMLALTLAALFLGNRRHSVADGTRGGTIRALHARLDEIAQERKNGHLSDEQAKLAEAEIARRLFRLEDEGSAGIGAGLTGGSRWIYVPLVAITCLAAVPLYLYLGTPDYPDQPLSARLQKPPEDVSVDELLARVESHLADNPDDTKGWRLVAPVYRRLGRLDEAERAYRQILLDENLKPEERAELFSTIGELSLMKQEGVVTEPARQLFEQALEADPRNPKAGYYLALATEQTGDKEAAIMAWQDLIERHKGVEAAWLQRAGQRLAALSPEAAPQPQTALPGPTREDVEAASELSGQARQTMITRMVASLAAKLNDNPDNIDGWLRLIRSHMVLGERDKAAAALTTARNHFAQPSAERGRIDALAETLKVPGA